MVKNLSTEKTHVPHLAAKYKKSNLSVDDVKLSSDFMLQRLQGFFVNVFSTITLLIAVQIHIWIVSHQINTVRLIFIQLMP